MTLKKCVCCKPQPSEVKEVSNILVMCAMFRAMLKHKTGTNLV